MVVCFTVEKIFDYTIPGSLSRYGALPVDVLAPVARSIQLALDFLWSQHVMHRGENRLPAKQCKIQM